MTETVRIHQIRPYVNSPHADSKGANCPKGRGVLHSEGKMTESDRALKKDPLRPPPDFRAANCPKGKGLVRLEAHTTETALVSKKDPISTQSVFK